MGNWTESNATIPNGIDYPRIGYSLDANNNYIENLTRSGTDDLDEDNNTAATAAVAAAAAAAMATEDALDTVPCSSGLFFFLVYGPIYGIVCGLGLVGNSLSFAVLHKYTKHNVATYLLKALAIVDNVFLATAAFIQMYPAMMMYLGRTDQLTPIYTYFQTFAWPLAHMVQIGTVWMMVLVAANRYIAVCRPLHAATLCTKRSVQRQIAVMVAAIVVYSTPRFAEYKFRLVNVTDVDADGVNVTSEQEVNVGLAGNQLYNILYENIAYCLVAYLVPLSVLVVFNVHLVRELKRAQRCRLALIGRASAEENNITLVMIVIIISFIVCQTPASINQILYYIVDDARRTTCSAYFRYYHIANLLITTNSSLNFVIYCLFRRQFQQEVLALLWCSGSRGSGGSGGDGSSASGKRPLRRTILLRALHGTGSSSGGGGGGCGGGSRSTAYEGVSRVASIAAHERGGGGGTANDRIHPSTF